MASVLGSTQAVLEGSLYLTNSNRLAGVSRSKLSSTGRQFTIVRAQAQGDSPNTSRRAVLGVVATSLASGSFVQAVLADAKSIMLGAPPPPSGGLPGTLNSDEARDLDLPLNQRFFLQSLPPVKALVRAKESKDDILKVRSLIDKKAWPYVQNDLRLKAGYLRFDLKTIISSKTKDEKKILTQLENAVFSKIDELDYAAKMKSSSEAATSYAASKSALDELFAKLG